MGENLHPQPGPLIIAVAPASDHVAGLDLRNLAKFLGEQMETSVTINFCRTYAEAIEALRSGNAQIGWLGSFAYIEASREGFAESFAVGIPKGKGTPNYQSVFITHRDSSIRRLADIKGRKIAMGNVHSTSGYIIPRRELAEEGLSLDTPDHFKEIVVTGNHDDAIRLVLDGKVDVAAVSSVNLDENIRNKAINKDSIRIIHVSKDIPGAPLVFKRSLDANIKKRIKTLVLRAHESIDIGGYGGAMDRYIDPAEGKIKLLESYLRPQWGWRIKLGISGGILSVIAIAIDLEINILQLFQNTAVYLFDVLNRMFPPDFSNFGQLVLSMIETIEIAILGTILAIALSIPIGLFSAKNIAPNTMIYFSCRSISIFFRAIPEFIMAMILVIAVGFGAVPGVVALGFHTMGFLAKFYAEAIEHVNTRPGEAMESMGASRAQVVAFSVVPQIMPSFIGYNLYILDRNIRMATMLGIVGAGGIGYELQSSFRLFEYQRVSAIILLIFATIFVIDMISSYIRSKAM